MGKKSAIVPVESSELEISEPNKTKSSGLQTVCTTVNVTVPVFSTVARDLIASRERIATLKCQIELIKENNRASLTRMREEFDRKQSTINSINRDIEKLIDYLCKFNPEKMSSEDHATCRALLSTACQMREQVLSLFREMMK